MIHRSLRLAIPAVALCLGACGGGGDGGPPPTEPPPPPPPAAAAVTIVAGDGQQAEPNATVETAPSVVVRSSSGAVVPNVTVTFTVDSGGGSVGVPSAVTDANGVASSGSWRLGATESPQVLLATVGSLAPVRFRATARIVEKTVVTQTIAPAMGGTITVDRPSSPLHGVSLQLDRGALTSSTTITLRELSSSAFTVPAGMQALSPGLGIAGDVGELGAAAVISFPVTPVAGKVLMIGVMDPASGKLHLLPTLSQHNNRLSALLPALDARLLSTATTSSLARMVSQTAPAAELRSVPLLIGINEELLAEPVDVGFRPGVDDWDFPPMSIAALPFLTKETSPIGGEYALAADGLVSTSLWYFANRRKAGDAPLYGSMQEAKGEPLSSRRGIRWAALAEANVPSFNQTGSLAALEWEDFFTEDRARFSRLQFLAIKALMLTTERPTPVALMTVDDPDEFQHEEAPLAIAYRAEGNTLYLAVPGEPGKQFTVQFGEQGMVPFSVQQPNGGPLQVRAVAGIHYVNVVNNRTLSEQWTRVANKTIGVAEGWPTPTLHWEKAALDTASIFLLDELQHWWQCEGCPERAPAPPQLPASASHVMRSQFGRFTNGTFSGLRAETFSSLRFAATDVFTAGARVQKLGSVVWHPLSHDPELGIGVGWLDFITTTYRKLVLTPSTGPIRFSKDTTITVTVTPSEAPPQGTRYRWRLRTETGSDSTETATATHTRQLKAGAKGWLIVSALEGEHKRPIARDSVEIAANEPFPAWRLTSFVDADDLFDEDFAPFDLWADLLSRPGSGLLIVEAQGADTVLHLRVKRAGVWTEADCCPVAPFDPTRERELLLGVRPMRINSVGPYFSRWASTIWSQSATDLATGTFTGTSTFGDLRVWSFENGGSQQGPSNGLELSATRNGLQITGTITVAIWPLDFDTREIEDTPALSRFLFTGTRLR